MFTAAVGMAPCLPSRVVGSIAPPRTLITGASLAVALRRFGRISLRRPRSRGFGYKTWFGRPDGRGAGAGATGAKMA